MSSRLQQRLGRLEDQGLGRCPECDPERIGFRVSWPDYSERAEPEPQVCSACGRLLERVVLEWPEGLPDLPA